MTAPAMPRPAEGTDRPDHVDRPHRVDRPDRLDHLDRLTAGSDRGEACPVRRYGDTLVVLEGASRVVWRRTGQARWTPTGVWPSGEQAASLRALLAEGGSLLVLLGTEPSVVSVLGEELAGAPSDVRALADTAEDPVDLYIPCLDWLPEPLRQRGLAFLLTGRATVAARPAALLPRLLIDDPDPAWPNVRFALRTTSTAVSESCVASVVEHVLQDRPATG